MGTPQAAVLSLERCIADGHEIKAVYTQPDRPSGRGNKILFSPVKICALDHGIEVFQPAKIRTPEAASEFRAHKADAAVVVAYGRILPDAFLTAFMHGAINVHFSRLPKYRGAAPVNWAIINGENETGVTTMKMDAGLDTGDILLQEGIHIGSEETSIELMERLSVLGADVLSRTLAAIETIVPSPQDHDLATLAPIMKKQDGLINWSMSAEQIANRVRGFQPFPTAFTSYRGSRLTIWRARAVDLVSDRPAGQIIEIGKEEIMIACGDGDVLSVSELQPEGKRRLSARDFINGARPAIRERLGN